MFPEVLAKLRALSLYYKTGHWQVRHSVFYSDHKLLDRLSESAEKHIDDWAEKSIGITGNVSLVNLNNHLALMTKILASYPTECSENVTYFKTALICEQELQTILKQVEAQPEATVGLKNLIGDICDESESRTYLLKQRISAK